MRVGFQEIVDCRLRRAGGVHVRQALGRKRKLMLRNR